MSALRLGIAGRRRSADHHVARCLDALVAVGAVALTAAIYTKMGALGLGLPAEAALLIASVPGFAAGGAVHTRLARRDTRAPRHGLLALPFVSFYTAFFLGPLILLCVSSVATSSGFGDITYGFSLSNFNQVGQSLYVKIMLRTLGMAALGTALTILIGYPVAYWLARHAPRRHRSLLLALVILPFWTSFLIRTYSFLIILSDDFGLARLLRTLGLHHGPLHLLYTGTAVQIGLVYNYLPLFVLPAYAALERMDWSLVSAANDLGASGWKSFRDVTFRLTLPGILTGILLVFIPMTGEYVVPSILGGGTYGLVGNLIESSFLEEQNYPLGSALALTVMAALSLVLIAYLWLSMRTEERFGA